MTTVLLTGGTGAFGKYLIEDLLKEQNVRIILLIRAGSHEAARERVKENANIPDRIEIYASDLTLPRLGLSDPDYSHVQEQTTHILHAAASTRFNLSLEDARKNNVETTKDILLFAEGCPNLKRFGYVSSALVAGKRSGTILEDEFEHKEGFLNTYQQSKYEAESLVRGYEGKFSIVIFRPPLLINPFAKGSGRPTNLLTLSLFLARKGFLPLLPGTPDAYFDIMDSKVVADLVTKLLLKNHLSYSTYHLTSGQNTLKVKDIISAVEEHTNKKLTFHFAGTMESFNAELEKRQKRNPLLRLMYKKTSSFLPELAYPKMYSNMHTLQELGIDSIHHNAKMELKSILS